MKNTNKAQVWVETAIYTLIGLTIIAILLATLTPEVDKIKDQGIIRQTMDAMTVINSKISDVEQAPGSVGIINLKIAKGKLEIDAVNNLLRYTLGNTKVEFSQIGEEIKEGDVFVKTEKYGNNFNVILTMYYNSTINITYNGNKELKTLQAGTTPYKLSIENVGDNLPTQNTHLDFSS